MYTTGNFFRLTSRFVMAASFLFMASATPAYAHYCDPAIKASLATQAAQQYSARASEIQNYWQSPNSIDNMFCGGAFSGNIFNNILSGLGDTDILGLITGFLKNQANQLCQQAVQSVLAPINSATAAVNSCTQQITSPESYLDIIARNDPAFLNSLYNSSYNSCSINTAVDKWIKLHPGAK